MFLALVHLEYTYIYNAHTHIYILYIHNESIILLFLNFFIVFHSFFHIDTELFIHSWAAFMLSEHELFLSLPEKAQLGRQFNGESIYHPN